MRTINVSLSTNAHQTFDRLYELRCHEQPADFLTTVKDPVIRNTGSANVFLELEQSGLISKKREGIRILALPGRRINQPDPIPLDEPEIKIPQPKRPPIEIPGDDWTTNKKGMDSKKLKKLVDLKNGYYFTRTKFPKKK